MGEVVRRINRFKTLEALLIMGALLMCLSVCLWMVNQILLAILFCILSLGQFYVVDCVSREPEWSAYNFVHSDCGNDYPTLVCLGDSITHGRISSNWVASIQPKISRPLNIINNGQNGITTYTTFQERADWTMACNPNYVVVLIGTNDAIALSDPFLAPIYQSAWGLRDPITPVTIEANLKGIVEKLLKDPKVQVALCTIPPLGEDLDFSWNQCGVATVNDIIRKVHAAAAGCRRVALLDVYGTLEGKIREKSPLSKGSNVKMLAIHGLWLSWAKCIFQGSWNDLSRRLGNVVLTDGVHVNDDGGDMIAELVVNWLREEKQL